MSKILETNFTEEIKDSYIDYSLSVLLSRALPDVRDGLKPVQRRILYAMYDLNLTPNTGFKKCATIVGEVIGKYHPHGDSSVYEALVRMAQNFTMNYPLIWGQGNFGSIDGDPPAAYRYTEAKLSEIGLLMLQDIELDTVDFRPNFDETEKEPVVLPSVFPNLLVNGSNGIAVGMVTNIPPHNLGEICDACIKIIDDPNISIKEILEIVKGPDFPTGGIVYTSKIIKSIYSTGKGILKIEGKYRIENINKKDYFVIYEIPYSVNKSKIVKEIAEAIKDKKIPDVTDVIDQSNNQEMKILLELKNQYNEKQVLNYLRNFTSFRTTFYCAFIAVDGYIPKQYSILELLQNFINHRKNVIKRKTKTILENISKKTFLLKALIKATKNIDKVIEIIKTSNDYKSAALNLISLLQISYKQAEYILNLQLHRLTKLEINKLINEYNQNLLKIQELSQILDNPNKLDEILKEELIYLKNEYAFERKTYISSSDDFKEVKIEKPQIVEDLSIFSFSNGYIYFFKASNKDKALTNLSNYNYITSILEISSQNKILVFLSNGKYSLLNVSKMIDSSIFVPRFFKALDNTKAIFLLAIRKISKFPYLLVATKKGIAKLINTKELLDTNRISTYIKLDEDDEVIKIIPIHKENIILGITEKGYLFKVKAEEIPEYSKNAKGAKIASLKDDDNLLIIENINELYDTFVVILTQSTIIKINTKEVELVTRGKNLTEKNKVLPKNEKLKSIPQTSIGILSKDKTKMNIVVTENQVSMIRLPEELDEANLVNFVSGY
ncbi:MAG: DNA topoisomerase (ATP-hydrolyzing) subunit A [bacterium]